MVSVATMGTAGIVGVEGSVLRPWLGAVQYEQDLEVRGLGRGRREEVRLLEMLVISGSCFVLGHVHPLL